MPITSPIVLLIVTDLVRPSAAVTLTVTLFSVIATTTFSCLSVVASFTIAPCGPGCPPIFSLLISQSNPCHHCQVCAAPLRWPETRAKTDSFLPAPIRLPAPAVLRLLPIIGPFPQKRGDCLYLFPVSLAEPVAHDEPSRDAAPAYPA